MKDKLALDGGVPVRRVMLPYGRQSIEPEDIDAIVSVLKSDWLTTGPNIGEFENAFSIFCGAKHSVAVNSGTAALHAAAFAAKISPGDEVIVTPMTFAASANCVVYEGGMPVFADVDPKTLLIDPTQVEARITPRTKAIIAVDYGGQPCDYPSLRAIADRYGLLLIADACHAVGGSFQEQPVGTLADLNTFSFHPVKHITTGEGGMVTTQDETFASQMRSFRNHGITRDHRIRAHEGSWFYEMEYLGYNYRLTDFQCVLGMSQLNKLSGWVKRRRAIASQYDQVLASFSAVKPLKVDPRAHHAYHLYVIRLDLNQLRADRAQVFRALRAEGIGVNVHYIPVHLHPYYQRKFHTAPGLCPQAEKAYDEILTLPIFPGMQQQDVDDVLTAVDKVVRAYQV